MLTSNSVIRSLLPRNQLSETSNRLRPGGASCHAIRIWKRPTAFESMSKRRRSYPSETRVKRGPRIVHAGTELIEKLGRNDLCPCGSGRRFQTLLPEERPLRRRAAEPLLSGTSGRVIAGSALRIAASRPAVEADGRLSRFGDAEASAAGGSRSRLPDHRPSGGEA
jgi:SEC-C motif